MSTAKLIIDGKEYILPVIESSMGEKAIDIQNLRTQTGCVTYDPAFGNTAVCKSSITFVDGEKGILRYRGMPVEDLVKNPNFIEIAWMLIFGKLPSPSEYERFSARLSRNCHLHEGIRHILQTFPANSPPMAMLGAGLKILACYDPMLLRIEDQETMEEAAARLISKVRTIAAYIYRNANGFPINYPDPRLDYCGNFLHMMFSEPYQDYMQDLETIEVLNTILILHADHEQNASTSTVRLVESTQANLFTSIAAGISSLWGPRHGGANVEVMEMLENIQKGGITISQCIERAKDKKDPFKLSGFGHRIYKSYDPRARVLKSVMQKYFDGRRYSDPLIETALRLEEAALADSYFVDRNLYPNVDFYSGILLRALGIPTSMFTVMFAIGRLPGWIAHWHESHTEAGNRIYRPRQVYTGPAHAAYIPPQERT